MSHVTPGSEGRGAAELVRLAAGAQDIPEVARQGRIIGKFRNVHLPMIEGENGITPGRDYPVFETDFGRVGIMTCWDTGRPNRGARFV